MPADAESPGLPEIRLAGFLHSGLGLGEMGRRIARSLQAAGVPLLTHAWEKTDVAAVPFETTAPGTADSLALALKASGRSTPGSWPTAGPSRKPSHGSSRKKQKRRTPRILSS